MSTSGLNIQHELAEMEVKIYRAIQEYKGAIPAANRGDYLRELSQRLLYISTCLHHEAGYISSGLPPQPQSPPQQAQLKPMPLDKVFNEIRNKTDGNDS